LFASRIVHRRPLWIRAILDSGLLDIDQPKDNRAELGDDDDKDDDVDVDDDVDEDDDVDVEDVDEDDDELVGLVDEID